MDKHGAYLEGLEVESVALEAPYQMCADASYPGFPVAEKAGDSNQLIDTPMTMILQSFCTTL